MSSFLIAKIKHHINKEETHSDNGGKCMHFVAIGLIWYGLSLVADYYMEVRDGLE